MVSEPNRETQGVPLAFWRYMEVSLPIPDILSQYNAASIQCRLNTMPPQYTAASIQCRLNTMPPPHFFAIPTSPPFRLLRHCDCFTIPTASPFRVLRHFDFFTIPTSSPFRLLRHSDFFAIPTSSSFPWDWIQHLSWLD
jgi:hypothetical protein